MLFRIDRKIFSPPGIFKLSSYRSKWILFNCSFKEILAHGHGVNLFTLVDLIFDAKKWYGRTRTLIFPYSLYCMHNSYCYITLREVIEKIFTGFLKLKNGEIWPCIVWPHHKLSRHQSVLSWMPHSGWAHYVVRSS